ncbi:MAG: hypothetical protein U9R58_02775 [Chloroflexota bacterium]|nr:hypothetical protein [Chloroflexota bacterium]
MPDIQTMLLTGMGMPVLHAGMPTPHHGRQGIPMPGSLLRQIF